MKKIMVLSVICAFSVECMAQGVQLDQNRAVGRVDTLNRGSGGPLPVGARARGVSDEAVSGGVGKMQPPREQAPLLVPSSRGIQSYRHTEMSPLSDEEIAQTSISAEAERLQCAECDVVTNQMIAPQLAVGDPRCARCFTDYQPVVPGAQERMRRREENKKIKLNRNRAQKLNRDRARK